MRDQHKIAGSGATTVTSNASGDITVYTPIATATVLGGVKSKATGTTAGRDYNVQVNSDGTMKVNVPWTDTNTHYAANFFVGTEDSTTNDVTKNGETYLKLFENGVLRDLHNIKGAGATTVESDDFGDITITTPAKAADADKLDGQDSSYYLNYNNLKNRPPAYKYTYQNGYLVVQAL